MPAAKYPHARRLDALRDEWLVVRLQSGDRAAGDELAASWHPRLLRTARRYLGDDSSVETSVQECWLAILRGIGGLRDPARFAPWAFGILRRKCADRVRQAQRERGRDAELEEQPVAARQEDAAALRSALAALPPDQRLSAQLFYVEGLTLAEIAEAQAVPEGTAKSRLFHARRKLKAALSEGDDP